MLTYFHELSTSTLVLPRALASPDCQSLIQTREHLSHQLHMNLPWNQPIMRVKRSRMTTPAMTPLRNSVNPRKRSFASVIRRIPVNTLSINFSNRRITSQLCFVTAKILHNTSTVNLSNSMAHVFLAWPHFYLWQGPYGPVKKILEWTYWI